MSMRMLIDARHPEETRVAVLKGNRIEEFDFESADHKQIKGNIYLAKVTRVEPSLQAAFVDFGGNRHGFLAFSEIHPDYYQIPREDRERLLAEEAEAAEEEAKLRAEEEEDGHAPGDEYDAEDETGESFVEEIAEDGVEEIDTSDKDHVSTIEGGHVENGEDDLDNDSDEDGNDEAGEDDRRRSRGRGRRQGKGGGGTRSRAKQVDEVRARRMALRRRYKIQDVIQRRQVLLVQVVKEERGNKGAALTTYLSLAGRYTVLMPNSSHGGGISRKISSASDRKRLKQIVSDLVLPKSMGLIVRTAWLSRTKPEIKRDFDYLARLWDEIREKTLSSSAPKLIHSDSDLIKRAIRDIYNREIEEVVVEGDEGYKSAREFMKLLMPSHARRVKAYTDPLPLFQRYGAEDQLRAMYDPVVQLKSGGYLVINPTEALVSIDINSGRSTKEHGIEATALSTNLEAAREIARHLRLRDMAGLIVIDFIDMEYGANVRKVEKAMKDALRNDRARIQVGRISGFGLMEMSRQRLRTGVLEATTRHCPHCDGTGLVRTASSAGLSALRLIEEEAARGKGNKISLRASQEATFYLLNEKRRELREIEELYGVTVEILPDGETEGARMAVEVSGPPPVARRSFAPIAPIEDDDDDDYPEDEEDEAEEAAAEERPARSRDREEGGRDREDGDTDGEGRKRRRRRRRGRRGRRDDEGNEIAEGGEDQDGDAGDAGDARDDEAAPAEAHSETAEAEEAEAKPRRRRGGRGRKPKADAVDGADEAAAEAEPAPVAEAAATEPAAEEAPATEEKPKRKRAPRKTKAETEAAKAAADAAEAPAPVEAAPVEALADEAEPAKPAPKQLASRAKKAVAAEAAPEPAATREAEAVAANGDDEGDSPDGEPRRGWWQRTFGN